LIAFLLLEACGVALVVVEGRDHHPHLSIVDGLSWAMMTVTTVGYGDVTAVTNEGRLIGMCIMVVGLGFVAIVTGAVAQYVIVRESAEAQDASTNDLLAAIHELKHNIHNLAVRLEHLEPDRHQAIAEQDTPAIPEADGAGDGPRRPTSSPQHGLPRTRRTAPGHGKRSQPPEQDS
jgi:voltage-gated potassium channel